MADVQHNALTGTDLHAPFDEGATAPGSPTSGMYWLNTNTMVLSRYNGTAWIEVSPTVAPILPNALPVYATGDFVDPWVGVVPGTVTANNWYPGNQSYAVPIYIAKDCQINGLALVVGQAAPSGSRAKMALIAPDVSGLPGAVIKVAANIPVDTTGVLVGSFTAMAVSRGMYWIATVTNGSFATNAITNPLYTPIPYLLDTGAAKSMCRVPVNYVDEFRATWNADNQPIAFAQGAYRFAVRIA